MGNTNTKHLHIHKRGKKPKAQASNYEEEIPDDKRKMPQHDYNTPVDMLKSKVQYPKRISKDRDDIRYRNIYVKPLDMEGTYKPPVHKKSVEDNVFIYDAIKENFIFAGLGEEELTTLVKAMELYSVPSGTTIIAQGSTIGDYFYVLKQGKVQFYVDGQSVGAGTPGATFGELSLLYNCPRTATCIANQDCELWKVDQEVFRKTVAAFQMTNDKAKVDILRDVDIFKDLDEDELNKIAEAVTEMGYKEGDKIVQKGTLGDVFYIVKKGTVVVTDIGLGVSEYVDQELGEGDFFGERAIMTGDVRAANITAKSDCIMYVMTRDDFDNVLGPYHDVIENKKIRNRMLEVPIIASNMDRDTMNDILSVIEDKEFKKDTILYNVGDIIKPTIYMICSGKVSLVDEDDDLKMLTNNDYFGDKFPKAAPRYEAKHTVKFLEDTTCAVLDLRAVQIVLQRGSVATNITGQSNAEAVKSSMSMELTLESIKKHRVLGEGTFGQVWLVVAITTKKPYALKVQSKKWLIEKGQDRGVMREKNIMAMIDHPFVMKLLNAFQDERNLYMITKIYFGGELWHLMRETKHTGMSERRCKFYTGCILEGLSYMHKKKICYRDLKPENVLLDEEGYCVLIDLGFAKVVTSKTYTLCGTPLYIAPEVVLQRGHNKNADIWSLGVLIYELVVGKTPFYTRGIDQATLFKRICRAQYSIEGKCSSEAQNLIKRMLRLTPHDRIGCMAAGADDIRKHVWYKGVDFNYLIEKKFKAPWVPEFDDPLDCQYFEEWDKLERNHDDDLPLTEKEQKAFKGF